MLGYMVVDLVIVVVIYLLYLICEYVFELFGYEEV